MAKIICSSCGLEFDDNLPKCPACGSFNYKGAEAEYLDKLDDVRENLENLEAVHGEAVKAEWKQQGRRIRRIAAAVTIIVSAIAGLFYWLDHRYDRDDKRDFLWKQEMFPVWDELYENQEYDRLVEAYLTALEEERPTWEWKHDRFIDTYLHVQYAENVTALEASGEKVLQSDYEWLLYDEMSALANLHDSEFTEEELKRLEPYFEEIRADLEARWQITEEDYSSFADKDFEGFADFDACSAFVKKWYEGGEKR